MNKAEIVNMYKHKIIHKNLKGKLKKQVVFSLCIFGVLASVLSYFKIFMNKNMEQIFTSASQVFNPLSGLYNENESAIFINSGSYIFTKDLEFCLPVKSGKVEVKNNEVNITVQDSIMVYACEGGIVTECGISNSGSKYIKIMHSESIFSIVDNVDVIGCDQGDVVKKGREIGTCTPNSIVKISFFKDEKIAENIVVEKNVIKWM